MCYKVATPEEAELHDFLAPYSYEVEHFEHYYHADGFQRPYLPVLSNDTRKVQPARWKLIPHWVKTEDEANKYANTLNARCEEVFDKASYKSYIQKNRGLLFVKGFIEPNHPNPEEPPEELKAVAPKGFKRTKVTIPYYVQPLDGKPLALGCVFADWVNKDTGEVTRTFSVITTEPNDLLRRIHNEGERMPYIVTPDNWNRWLSPLSKEEITAMMQPLANGLLQGYPLSGLVYKRGVNSNVPEVLESVGEVWQ